MWLWLVILTSNAPFRVENLSNGRLTLLSYAENLLSDDEFLVLWKDNHLKNQDFPWDSSVRLTSKIK